MYSIEGEYESLEDKSTGSHDNQSEYKTIVYPFERYEVEILLTHDGKFVGLTGIKVNKDFLSYKQKITSTGYIDVSDEYGDD
jgi:hypothetical protein